MLFQPRPTCLLVSDIKRMSGIWMRVYSDLLYRVAISSAGCKNCFPKMQLAIARSASCVQLFFISQSLVEVVMSLFRCAYFYAAICNEAHKLCAGVGATDVVRSARHPSGRCPENRRLSPQSRAKTSQIPTRFPNIVLAHNPACFFLLKD